MLDEKENSSKELENIKVTDNDNKVDEESSLELADNYGSSKRTSFIKTFSAAIVDQLIVASISYISLYIFDFLLRIAAGYFVSNKLGIYLIIYIIINVLYTSIIESSKYGNTIGRKMNNI